MTETIGRVLGGVLFWAVVAMLLSMLFSVSWNAVVPSRFGHSYLTPLDSLCLLSCIWIAGRMVGTSRAITVTTQEQE